jgi:hypothetical protein
MALFRALPEDDVEDLLSGGAPTSPSAAALADVVAVLRADATRRGAPPMSAELRAQIATVRPTAAPSRRRRVVAGGVLGIVFGTSVLGVAGAQNALPAVLQDAASSAADVVGIDLPRASERHQGDDDGEGEGTSTNGSDPSPQGEGSEGTGANGPKETTPGGANPADPADPGTPGDKEPADPADPADPATGNGNGTDNGQGTGAENGQGNGAENGQGNGTDNGQGTGTDNGQGEDASQGRRGGQP